MDARGVEPNSHRPMKRAISFQLLLLAIHGVITTLLLRGLLPPWLTGQRHLLICAIIAGGAGNIYCLRSVYITLNVREVPWNNLWLPWYFIRPIVSPFCGVVAYFFLKAGLLILDASLNSDNQFFGFYAIAFIAGYNVDMFLVKIELLAEAAWGIALSPTARRDKKQREGAANKDRAAAGKGHASS